MVTAITNIWRKKDDVLLFVWRLVVVERWGVWCVLHRCGDGTADFLFDALPNAVVLTPLWSSFADLRLIFPMNAVVNICVSRQCRV